MIFTKEALPIWKQVKKDIPDFADEFAALIDKARTGGQDERFDLAEVMFALVTSPFGGLDLRRLAEDVQTKTLEDAFGIFEEGAAKGHANSILMSGVCYAAGAPCPQDLGKAKALYNKIKDSADVDDERKEYLEDLIRGNAMRAREDSYMQEAGNSLACMDGDPFPGLPMPDGSIFAGRSMITGERIFVVAEDDTSRSFNDAVKNAKACTAHGHADWQVPSPDEFNVIYNNIGSGGLRGTFNKESAYWASESGQPYLYDPDSRIFLGGQKYEDAGRKFNARYMRKEP